MTSTWRKFFCLSFSKQVVFIECTAWLLVFRMLISILPFKWISYLIGLVQAEQSPLFSTSTLNDVYARNIGLAIGSVSRRIGFKKPCMLEALAALQILRLRGVSSILIIGAGYDSSRSLQAHAWLTSGTRTVTGARGSENYAAISIFAPKQFTPLSV